jgi:hypothetical protein
MDWSQYDRNITIIDLLNIGLTSFSFKDAPSGIIKISKKWKELRK